MRQWAALRHTFVKLDSHSLLSKDMSKGGGRQTALNVKRPPGSSCAWPKWNMWTGETSGMMMGRRCGGSVRGSAGGGRSRPARATGGVDLLLGMSTMADGRCGW